MAADRPIVVGTDGSPSSLQAVSWAAKEAALRNAPLTVLTTTFVPGAYGFPVGLPPSFFEEEELEAKKRLARAAEVAADAVPGHSLEIHTVLGTETPAGELVERSKTARMVVVGANRQGIIERMFLGSVSSAVATHAHCPVAVIHGLPDTDINALAGPVVVGVDGSAHTEPAVSMAFEEAALRHTELVAVHAWSDVDLHLAFEGGTDPTWMQEVVKNETARLSERLAGHAEKYPDVKVRPVVVIDQPAHGLREEAENAQLLVVGSRGRGGFTSLLLGSTSRALMHSVNCPLLIVR
ncbi:universal stress protein [Rhodococcus sp. JS3073]|uniref:universal stress protein n=1 Tax=Rhodococcus sp. JS3073 TaxID=3002901 RepID=UPI002286B77A|nr:universal stress protein [Rhodococcus sp. JS3073]WAM19322.1 universal stress protein [Rhodococcus sp. JS3073]